MKVERETVTTHRRRNLCFFTIIKNPTTTTTPYITVRLSLQPPDLLRDFHGEVDLLD